jgi:hypothetical protein
VVNVVHQAQSIGFIKRTHSLHKKAHLVQCTVAIFKKAQSIKIGMHTRVTLVGTVIFKRHSHIHLIFVGTVT